MQKNIYRSIAAAAVVLVVGVVVFHDHEDVTTAIGIASFFGSLALFVVLEDREWRAIKSRSSKTGASPRPDR
jgi:hypothetical protein